MRERAFRWFFLCLVVAFAVGTTRGILDLRRTSGLVVEVGLETLRPTEGERWQLFFDRGRGIVEEDSVAVRFDFSNGVTAVERFVVPPGTIRMFRLDPPPGEVGFAVREIRLLSPSGELVDDIDPARLSAGEGLDPSPLPGGGLLVRGQGSLTDPQLVLRPLPGERWTTVWEGGWEALGSGLATFAVLFVALLAALWLGRRFAWPVFKWVFSFRTPFPPVEPLPAGRRFRVVGLSFLFAAPLLLWLAWPEISTPGLLVEDSHHYFNRYYGGDSGMIDALAARPNGYYNIGNNLFAWFAAKIDVRAQAAVYHVFAVFCFFAACLLPASAPLFRDRRMVFALFPVLALAGMNHVFYLVTLTFQMYVLIVVLLGILIIGPPRGKIGLVVQCLLVVFLVFSGPYSVVAVPTGMALLLLFRQPRKQWIWGTAVVAGVVYLQMTPGMARFQNLLEADVVRKMFEVAVEQVFFLDMGGEVGAGSLILFVSLFALPVVLNARDPGRMRMILVLLALVVLSLTPLFLSRKFVFYSDPYPCHILIARFFWIFLVMFLLDGLLSGLSGRVRSGLAWASLAGLGVFVWWDSRIRPGKFEFEGSRDIGPFLQAIHAAESAGLKERNEFTVIAIDPDPRLYFKPRVLVGSRHPDAVEVPPDRFWGDEGESLRE